MIHPCIYRKWKIIAWRETERRLTINPPGIIIVILGSEQSNEHKVRPGSSRVMYITYISYFYNIIPDVSGCKYVF